MSRIPTTGDDDLFRKFSGMPGDQQALYKLQTLAMVMSLEELQRFCEGTMNALVVVQDQYRKRFPREWAAWDKQFNDMGSR